MRAIIQPPATVDLEQEHDFFAGELIECDWFLEIFNDVYIHRFIYYNNLLYMYNCKTNIGIFERTFVSSSEGQHPERSALKS